MPKGSNRTRVAYPAMFSHQPGKSQDEMAYTVMDDNGSDKSVKGKHLRNIVGDEKAAALKAATDLNPKSRAGGKFKAEYSFGPVKNRGTAERKADAAKAKSTVDSAMDDAIEMVKKKKTTNRSAY